MTLNQAATRFMRRHTPPAEFAENRRWHRVPGDTPVETLECELSGYGDRQDLQEQRAYLRRLWRAICRRNGGDS